MIIRWRVLRKKSKGFTLIELMIVVAIIAILAAIAIPQYRKFQLKSKTSEAKTNIGAIRTCEEAYAAENDVYLLAIGYPDDDVNATKRDWNTEDVDASNYTDIGFKPAGGVYYNYTVANNTGTNFNGASEVPTADITPTGPTVQSRDNTCDIYILTEGDLDSDSSSAWYGATDEDGTVYGPSSNGDDF